MKYGKSIIVCMAFVCIAIAIVFGCVKKLGGFGIASETETNSAEKMQVETNYEDTNQDYKNNENSDKVQALKSTKDIQLFDVDGNSKNYEFKYNNETYTAEYTKDNWHINNSYKITDEQDIIIICQALIDEHKIHGKDMVSYRTAEDMAYEWLQHNTAYELLPEDNSWKNNAKDVDLDPADQGRGLIDMYNARAN